jgi:adenylate cyclase
MIQVDQATFRRLRDGFEFLEPQTIYLKGKGETMVFRMIGRRQAAQREAV